MKKVLQWAVVSVFVVIYAVVGVLWFLFSLIPCAVIEVWEMLAETEKGVDKQE